MKPVVPSSRLLSRARTGSRFCASTGSSLTPHASSALRCSWPLIQRCLKSSAAPSGPRYKTERFLEGWDQYKTYFDYPPQSSPEEFKIGNTVTVYGFLGPKRQMSSKLSFSKLSVDNGPVINVAARWEQEGSPEHLAHQALKSTPAHSAVALTGTIEKLEPSSDSSEQSENRWLGSTISFVELVPKSVHVLSPFPKDITVTRDAKFPPRSRHLQLRYYKALQQRLKFRHEVQRLASTFLDRNGFSMVETPVLFKSTPEGAREFLVPTRQKGFAYALPQSPQQYKQILMASGVGRYYQFARCFRDEDLRTDRQPEFTQLDLEMSFSRGEDVMRLLESLVRELLSSIESSWILQEIEGDLVPVRKQAASDNSDNSIEYTKIPSDPFPRMTYQEAMSSYGSDKPDLRIPNKIQRIDNLLPQDFIKMITDLENPIVEAVKFRLNGEPGECRDLAYECWENLPPAVAKNPDGEPVYMVYDPTKPLAGLAPLGHEFAMRVADGDPELGDLASLEAGDVLVIQARPDKPFEGGSTALGTLRIELYNWAVEKGFLKRDRRLMFLWVHGFPLFMPNNDTDPGQGGSSGFSATHHPFTAPLGPEDFEMLRKDPLRVKADHYDLVLNGVELGGGSRRVHIAEVQEYIFRDILKMTKEGLSHFAHLIEALRAGCPPHAGFAFGWDRLIAMLSYTNSVRDVIAFPKNMKGEDLMVNSPGPITNKDLATYHLAVRKEPNTQSEVSS
ncbi:Aspartyl-tRNA synthetase [Pleurostoma richardsiae]|uniref:Aspartyl-tRNA synthetase n=1 Tax=Pleurostoma richardsiae TaxID=41990 RepID=A0AA38VBM3_9PEZI|nr:Aspartyl-tRNA synthetase [Pleurostoma richardsiae]